MAAILGISATGITLMCLLPSVRAQIQLAGAGALAFVVVRSVRRADDTVTATLRVAEQMVNGHDHGETAPAAGPARLAEVTPIREARHRRLHKAS